jgi:hypothetical protein
MTHGFGIAAGFAPDTIGFLLPIKGQHPTNLGISFDGRSAQIIGEQELPGKTNYFQGNNPGTQASRRVAVYGAKLFRVPLWFGS